MLKKKNWSRKIKRKSFIKIKPNIFSHSFWYSKFVNKFMQRGNKAVIENIVFRVFKKIKMDFHRDGLKVLFFSLIKNRPLLGFAPVRIRRETKQVPFPLSPKRQLILSLKWFIHSTKWIRYQGENLSIENVLYTQLKDVVRRKKTSLIQRRIDHVSDLIQNRINLNYRYKIKK